MFIFLLLPRHAGLDFLRLGGHQAVQPRGLIEAIPERDDDIAVEQQSLALLGVGDIRNVESILRHSIVQVDKDCQLC